MAGLLGVALASSALAFTASSSSADETSDGAMQEVVEMPEMKPDMKIDFCHKNENQPDYVPLSLPPQAIMNEGHGEGPAHADDIIPPFEFKKGEETFKFEGRNWNEKGQRILRAGCNDSEGPGDDGKTWIQVSVGYVCLQDAGLNNGNLAVTWAIKNADAPAEKSAMIDKVAETINGDPVVDPAFTPNPIGKEIAFGETATFAQTLASSTSARTLELNADLSFSDPGKGPKNKSFSGSVLIPANACEKQNPPSTPTVVVPVPGPTVSATATVTATPSPAATPTATPVVTPEPAVTPTPEPVVVTPEAATAPTAVNAGDGSSAPQSGLPLWAMALAAVAAIGAAGASVRLATKKN